MGVLKAFDATVPDEHELQSLVSLLCLSFALVLTTTVVMDIGYIRHRWRKYRAASLVVALQGATLMFAWCSDISFCLVSLGLLYGFVDPRLHYTSFCRNPNPIWNKGFFALGAVTHHAGAALMLSEFIRPLVPTHQSAAAFPIPVLVTACLECLTWVIDLQVLYRTAWKTLFWILPTVHALQIVCCVILFLRVDSRASTPSLVAVVFGNFTAVVAALSGAKASTWETIEDDEDAIGSTTQFPSNEMSGEELGDVLRELPSTGQKVTTGAGKGKGKRMSYARSLHQKSPIVEDRSKEYTELALTA